MNFTLGMGYTPIQKARTVIAVLFCAAPSPKNAAGFLFAYQSILLLSKQAGDID